MEKAKTKTFPRKRLIAAGLMVGAAAVLYALFSTMGSAFFPGYRIFSRSLLHVLSTITGIVPIALWDIAAVLLVLVALATFVYYLVKKRSLLSWLSSVLCTLGVVLLLFVGGWALNHYAPPLASEIDLRVERYSTDQLAEATAYYVQRAAELAPQVPRNDDANLAKQDFFEMAKIAGASYSELGQTYPIFNGSTAPVKALLIAGEPLLYSGHIGIFFAPTGESNVPLNCAVAETPFTMCHEAAHRLAIASEDEANFAAFLACAHSSDVRFTYAAYYTAASHCLNALYASSYEREQELLASFVGTEYELGLGLFFLDRATTYDHYQPYEGTLEEVGTTVNDTYLKTFGETEGVQSYGMVVDYLIAWYQAL